MKNNWPETLDELLDECQRLISKYDLYTLGKRGEPFTHETEPRVDGTDYLAGEYQYGVAMIPAQWVRHVLSNKNGFSLSMTSATELLPCPFCGGEAEIESVEWLEPEVNLHSAKCKRCGAESAVRETKAEAIAAWNMRAADQVREPC